MAIRKVSFFGAALLGAAAIGYASFAQHPLIDEPQPVASASASGAPADDGGARMDSQRPRECDRLRNIDTECTYQ